MNKISLKSLRVIGFSLAAAISLPLNAAEMAMWEADSWSLLDAEDGVRADGYVGPGYGGQDFDAEYLFYKYNRAENLLQVGLQTGFDLIDGHLSHAGDDFYAGDLSLGFNNQGYEYAIDFGLVTLNASGRNVGLGSGNQDAAGFYQVSAWNNDINYGVSSPFAMDEGTLLSAIGNEVGAEGDSFYRIVSLDLDVLGFEVDKFSAHWTMSCGNDVVEGSAYVPEPSPAILLLGGLLALIGGRRVRNSEKV